MASTSFRVQQENAATIGPAKRGGAAAPKGKGLGLRASNSEAAAPTPRKAFGDLKNLNLDAQKDKGLGKPQSSPLKKLSLKSEADGPKATTSVAASASASSEFPSAESRCGSDPAWSFDSLADVLGPLDTRRLSVVDLLAAASSFHCAAYKELDDELDRLCGDDVTESDFFA